MILLDTSGLLAAIDSSQADHARAGDALRRADGPRSLSPFVLAELDYILATRVSTQAQHALLAEVARHAYRLEPFMTSDVQEAIGVMDRYKNLELGLADASIVVLAHRYKALDVLTLDRRHFEALRGPGGRRFRLLPVL